MMRNKKWIIGSLLAILLVGTAFATFAIAKPISEQTNWTSNDNRGNHRDPFMSQLTDEQRETLFQKMQELRESGASREEIREAMSQLMEELGINIDEIPHPPMMRP